MGQLKKQYSTQLGRLREMFPDWSTENLLTTLQENNGDLQAAATKISEGPYPTFKASPYLPFSSLQSNLLLCDPAMTIKLKYTCACF